MWYKKIIVSKLKCIKCEKEIIHRIDVINENGSEHFLGYEDMLYINDKRYSQYDLLEKGMLREIISKRWIKMTTIVYIGQGCYKKAYSVTIRERKMNKDGKITSQSITSASFQIKDIKGDSNISKIKQKMIRAL